jgi:hypothetical protein
MSPEQCAGKPVGPQSDQYSLGVVAYQLLTGTVPFDAESIPEILQHHWWTQAPDASQARPDSPAALTAAVQRMLAKPPEERFATTAELSIALDAIRLPDNTLGSGERQLREMVRALVPGEPAYRPRRTTPAVRTTPATPAVSATPVPPQPATRRLDIPDPPLAPPRSPRPVVARARRKKPGRWRYVVGIGALVTVLGAAGGAVAQRRSVNAVAVPKTAADMARIGRHAYRRGDYELARRFFVRAAALNPTNDTTQADLGCALQKLGRRADAVMHFRAAGESVPGECAVMAADAAADTNWLPPKIVAPAR